MSEKPENPFGACTEKEIKFFNISRRLSPKRREALYEWAFLYAWQERIIEDKPGQEDVLVREIADKNGITSYRRDPIRIRKDSNKDKK